MRYRDAGEMLEQKCEAFSARRACEKAQWLSLMLFLTRFIFMLDCCCQRCHDERYNERRAASPPLLSPQYMRRARASCAEFWVTVPRSSLPPRFIKQRRLPRHDRISPPASAGSQQATAIYRRYFRRGAARAIAARRRCQRRCFHTRISAAPVISRDTPQQQHFCQL